MAKYVSRLQTSFRSEVSGVEQLDQLDSLFTPGQSLVSVQLLSLHFCSVVGYVWADVHAVYY